MAILAISYEFGSGAEEIGRAVEKQLGYEYIALGRVLDEAKQTGKKWERFSIEYGEGSPNIWERYDWSFMGFMALVQSIILGHALRDNVVIMTRGANYLLRGIPHALRIRVVAPVEKRIVRVMSKEDISHDTARLLVRQADWEIASVIRQLYGKKWDDPEAYEIKFDTSARPMEEIHEIVRNLLAARGNLKSPEAQRQLEMRALAARIKAAVATNPEFLIPTLEVEPRGEEILLRGVARSIREHKAIDREVRNVSGSVPVTCEIHYRGIKSVKPHKIS
jgi:cytidylate kinase